MTRRAGADRRRRHRFRLADHPRAACRGAAAAMDPQSGGRRGQHAFIRRWSGAGDHHQRPRHVRRPDRRARRRGGPGVVPAASARPSAPGGARWAQDEIAPPPRRIHDRRAAQCPDRRARQHRRGACGGGSTRSARRSPRSGGGWTPPRAGRRRVHRPARPSHELLPHGRRRRAISAADRRDPRLIGERRAGADEAGRDPGQRQPGRAGG